MQRSVSKQMFFATAGCVLFGLFVWISILIDLSEMTRATLAVLAAATGLFLIAWRVGIISWASATVLFWLALAILIIFGSEQQNWVWRAGAASFELVRLD